ncbi:hypothetical protein ABK040_011627 [Willaertia magna]
MSCVEQSTRTRRNPTNNASIDTNNTSSKKKEAEKRKFDDHDEEFFEHAEDSNLKKLKYDDAQDQPCNGHLKPKDDIDEIGFFQFISPIKKPSSIAVYSSLTPEKEASSPSGDSITILLSDYSSSPPTQQPTSPLSPNHNLYNNRNSASSFLSNTSTSFTKIWENCQAKLPPLTLRPEEISKEDKSRMGKCVWVPVERNKALTPREVMNYEEYCKKYIVKDRDLYRSDKALEILHRFKYNVEKAKKYAKRHPNEITKQTIMTKVQERKIFEALLDFEEYGSLREIHRSVIPEKSYADLVNYFFLNKKDRRRIPKPRQNNDKVVVEEEESEEENEEEEEEEEIESINKNRRIEEEENNVSSSSGEEIEIRLSDDEFEPSVLIPTTCTTTEHLKSDTTISLQNVNYNNQIGISSHTNIDIHQPQSPLKSFGSDDDFLDFHIPIEEDFSPYSFEEHHLNIQPPIRPFFKED